MARWLPGHRDGAPMKIALLVSLLAAAGAVNCRSAPTPKETVKAVEDTEDLEELIEESNLPPEKKAQGKAKAANVKDTLQKQGETITRQAAEISLLEKYRAYVIGFCVATGLAIAAGIWFAIRWFIRRRAATILSQ